METVAKRIKELMTSLSLTNSEFAKRLDVNPSIVSHILSGRNKVSLQVVLQIKEAFPEVDLQELLVGIKSTSKKEPNTSLITNVNGDNPTTETIEKPKEQTTKSIGHALQIPNNLPSPSTAHKKIEKIIVLYTDKTMETYVP